MKLPITIMQSCKPALYLDTCSLLDVIRAPQIRAVQLVAAAKQIVFNLSDNTLSTIISSLVKDEFEKHCDSVRKETNSMIDQLDDDIDITNELLSILQMDYIKVVAHYSKLNLDKQLSNICKIIIDASELLPVSDDIHSKASARSISNLPPAGPGKNSSHDCAIYEQLLFMAKELRRMGNARQIIFVSSNKKDYEHKSVKNELNKLDVSYVHDLSWAMHEISNRGAHP